MSSEKKIKRNFSKTSVKESQWLLKMLRSNFGNLKDGISKYEKNAVFTFITNNTSNLEKLKNTKIRLYTEPDTFWWKKNRKASYNETYA